MHLTTFTVNKLPVSIDATQINFLDCDFEENTMATDRETYHGFDETSDEVLVSFSDLLTTIGDRLTYFLIPGKARQFAIDLDKRPVERVRIESRGSGFYNSQRRRFGDIPDDVFIVRINFKNSLDEISMYFKSVEEALTVQHYCVDVINGLKVEQYELAKAVEIFHERLKSE